MSSSADRFHAANILMRTEGGAFASRMLGRISAPGVRTRVLGVLRWLRAIDASIEGAARREVPSLDREVRTALRIGIYEAVSLGVPAPVAGDAAVRLVRKLGNGRASGFVNAVMRRAPGHWKRLMSEAEPAMTYSHPDWLWQRWKANFGEEQATFSMKVAQDPAPIWVWFPSTQDRELVVDRGVNLVPHPWMPGAWRSKGNELVEALRAGSARTQDPASQLVGWVAAAVGPPGGRLLDLCSAPGGKTAIAVREGSWRRVVAADLSLGRLVRAQLPPGMDEPLFTQLAQDAAYPALQSQSWDLVMLDAPCSGTGTLRRHPELRWRLHPADIAERASLQTRLLRMAAEMVAPNGVLLYSTCSVEPEENEHLLSETPADFERVDIGLRLPAGTPAIETSAGGVRLMPGDDWDGFTIHAIRRVANNGG